MVSVDVEHHVFLLYRDGTPFLSLTLFKTTTATTTTKQGLARLVFTCMLGRHVASTVLLVPKPFGGRWQRRWTCSCAKIKIECPSVAKPVLPEFGGRCRKAMLCSECDRGLSVDWDFVVCAVTCTPKPRYQYMGCHGLAGDLTFLRRRTSVPFSLGSFFSSKVAVYNWGTVLWLRPPVPNKPCGFCGRKAMWKKKMTYRPINQSIIKMVHIARTALTLMFGKSSHKRSL